MFKANKNPVVQKKEINGKQCLHFTFKETFTYDEAEDFIAGWKQHFSLKKHKKVVVVWELLEMDSYETEARTMLQQAIKDLKDNIEGIWLLTDSILIQAEAEIISFYTSFKIHLVKSEEELLSRMKLEA